VIVTDFEASPASEGLAPELRELAMDLAASIVDTDQVEDLSHRNLAELGLEGEVIPAGTWVIDLLGPRVVFDVEEAIPGASVTALRPTFFGVEDVVGEPDDASTLYVQAFQGFAEGVDVRRPIPEQPLSADEFVDGLDQVGILAEVSEVEVGGLNGVSYTVDVPDDSDFPCDAVQRARFKDGTTCVMYSIDGWMAIDEGDGARYLGVYLPDAGLAVSALLDDDGQPTGALGTLIDSMTILPQ
jgi:hypothetical protein